METMRSLNDSWTLGGRTIENRVVLAPLADIGNWFVRLQARRYGAGLTFSQMVSAEGIVRGNHKTCHEYLKVVAEEHPVSLQLFGSNPENMRIAAFKAAEASADFIDINMGCPVRKVCKTGAGVSLLEEPKLAVNLAKAALEGSGLPVSVKLRSGIRNGQKQGVEVARRLAEEAGVSAISFHPRSAEVQHRGVPDYQLARELVDKLPVPVVISGGLQDADACRRAFELTGAEALMLARGGLGNPWLFEELLGKRRVPPSRREIADELEWVVEQAEQHLGPERAGRYLRKFYPWYADTMKLSKQERYLLVTAPTTAKVRAALLELKDAPQLVQTA